MTGFRKVKIGSVWHLASSSLKPRSSTGSPVLESTYHTSPFPQCGLLFRALRPHRCKLGESKLNRNPADLTDLRRKQKPKRTLLR